MIKDAFFPLCRYGVYFDERVLDTQSLLVRIKKALPFLKNKFETTVVCGSARRPVKIRIVGRVKEGSHEKLVQQYNQLRATLSADLLASKRFRELHCRFTLFARDTLNAFDVFEEVREEASTATLDHFMNEGLDLSCEKTNTAAPTEEDLKTEKIIDTLISCESSIARLNKDIQEEALKLYYETKKITQKYPKKRKKVVENITRLQTLLVEKNFEVKKRRFHYTSVLQFHPIVYSHEIERIGALPKKSRHQLDRHLTRAKECLKRKAYDDAFEILQDLKPYRIKYKPSQT